MRSKQRLKNKMCVCVKFESRIIPVKLSNAQVEIVYSMDVFYCYLLQMLLIES